MTTEDQLSAPPSGFAHTLLADSPTHGIRYHLVVRIAEVTPLGSDEVIAAAGDESVVMIPVPLGELDWFSVEHLIDTAAAHMAGTYRSVTFDLSAVSFCDSSILAFFDWVHGFGGQFEVKVITSPGIERVLGLLAGKAQ